MGRSRTQLGTGRHARGSPDPGRRRAQGQAGKARGLHLLHLGSEGTQSRRRHGTAAVAGRTPRLRTPDVGRGMPRRTPGASSAGCGRAVTTSVTGFARPLVPTLPRIERPPCRPTTRSSVMTSRRDFIATAGLAATGLALVPLVACSQDRPDPASPRPREKPTGAIADIVPLGGALLTRAIPSSGETIPVIGVGTSGSYEVPLDSPEFETLRDVVKVFFEGGGRLIDTSPNYSNAEDVVGALLDDGGWRDRCFLATKLAADSRDALEAQWADSLRRLRTDRVELLQVHNLRNMAQAMPYARELKAQGKAKYIGITHYLERGHAETARLMRAEKPDFVQINYSVNAPQAAQ